MPKVLAEPASSARRRTNTLPEHRLFEFGCDWITATAKHCDGAKAFLAVGESLFRSESSEGNDIRPWHFKGYEGWTTGGCDFGVRDDGPIIRLRSGTARESWRQVFDVAHNVSRFDLQVTLLFPHAEPSAVVRRCWSNVKRTKLHGKPVQWHLRRDSSRGDTLEIGRRVSDKFGRAYDKHRQSKLDHYQKCVRLELEAHSECAIRYASALASSSDPDAACVVYVSQFFSDRGIPPALTLCSLPPIRRSPRATSLDRWLSWASTGVRPRVQKALEYNRLDDVLKALGLDHVVQPK